MQRDKWLKTGLGREEAIARAYADVAKTQPMFSQASDFTNGLRHVVPFAAFTTETLRVWKNVMQDRPHLAFFWNHAVESVGEVTAGIAGFDPEDLAAAKEAMPGYQQGKKMLTWPGKVEGKPMFLDMSYMIPLANIGGIDTAKASFFDYALIDPFTANPLVSFASALKTGVNPFSGSAPRWSRRRA